MIWIENGVCTKKILYIKILNNNHAILNKKTYLFCFNNKFNVTQNYFRNAILNCIK